MAKKTIEGQTVEVKQVRAADLIPDERNANRHTERGHFQLDHAIGRHGFRFAGTVDKNQRIVHGNHRHEVAGAKGIEDVVIVKADPNKQYFLQYDDLDLTDPTNPAREIAVIANRTAQVSIDLDPVVLFDLAAEGLDLSNQFFDKELERMFAGIELDLDFTTATEEQAGEQAGGNKGEYSGEGLEPSHIRMVQLFFTTDTHPQFMEWANAAARLYGTRNITDTVFEVMKHAASLSE